MHLLYGGPVVAEIARQTNPSDYPFTAKRTNL
jgi:hypothetical protein